MYVHIEIKRKQKQKWKIGKKEEGDKNNCPIPMHL